jgi:hypothetical protein
MATTTELDQPQYDPIVAMTNKLSATFRGITKQIPFNHPMLRALQVHFTYFIDEIQRGPEYDRSKLGFFVLKWVQKVGEALQMDAPDEVIDVELEKLLNAQYVHNNFYLSAT